MCLFILINFHGSSMCHSVRTGWGHPETSTEKHQQRKKYGNCLTHNHSLPCPSTELSSLCSWVWMGSPLGKYIKQYIKAHIHSFLFSQQFYYYLIMLCLLLISVHSLCKTMNSITFYPILQCYDGPFLPESILYFPVIFYMCVIYKLYVHTCIRIHNWG